MLTGVATIDGLRSWLTRKSEKFRLVLDLMSDFPTNRELSLQLKGNFAMARHDKILAMSRRLIAHSCASLFLTFLFLLLAAAPGRAQHMNEPDSPCVGVVVTSDLVACLSKAKDASDAKLNSVYQSIKKKLEGEDATRLVETQRIWIKYRDANCSAERALYEGGTAKYPASIACIGAMTRMRTKELQITYAVRLKD